MGTKQINDFNSKTAAVNTDSYLIQSDAGITERVTVGTVSAAFGGTEISGNATETVISVATTFVKVLGTFTSAATPKDMTVASNRLTYDGVPTRSFVLGAAMSMTGGNNVLLQFQFAKNGTLIGVPLSRWVSTGTDEGALALQAVTSMDTNDYIELWATNATSTANLVVTSCNFLAHGDVV